MKTYSDEELVGKALQGDEDAFTMLYERYHKRLEYIAYQLCKNSEDAKDAVQQTFMQIYTSLHTLRDPQRFYHWCCKIVHGKCTDMFRKNRDVTMDIDHSPLVSNMVEDRDDFLPQQLMHITSDREVLLSMLDQLPPAQKQVVLMVYFEQLSMQDCASILNVPEGTVKSRLFTAKKALRQMISSYNEQNQTPLNFKASTLEAMIVAALLKDYAAYNGRVPNGKSMRRSRFSAPEKATMAVIAVLTMATVGVAHYYHGESTLGLTTAQYQGSENYAKKAYFKLRNWAVNEKQMRNRDAEEIEESKKLYEYLKANDNDYYKILKQDGWSEAFEALYY